MLSPRVLIPLAFGATAGAALASNPKVQDSVNYGKYLGVHKYNIIKPMRSMGLGWGQTLKHDLSKIGPREFGPYRNWFEGEKGLHGAQDPEVYSNWRKAVRHHYLSPGNLHHYRALGIDQTAVPLKYRLEAVADWYSVNKTRGLTGETFPQWYGRLREKLPIAPETRQVIDERLGMTKKAQYILEKQAFPMKQTIVDAIQKYIKKFPRAANRIEQGVRNYTQIMNETAHLPPGSSEIVIGTRLARAGGKHIMKQVDRVGDAFYDKAEKVIKNIKTK